MNQLVRVPNVGQYLIKLSLIMQIKEIVERYFGLYIILDFRV
jgi:hypothetical protein